MKGNIKRIGLVLLTLLTLSLGTLVVNAETKDSDFVIENGVLKQYKGNDDTVYIPEGVTKITSDAFKREYSDYEKWGMYSGDMTERDNSFMLKDKFYARKGHMHLKMIIIFCLLINFVQERLFYHQR